MKNKPNITPKFAENIVEELKKVTWPTKNQTFKLTMVVILISLIIGTYVGIIDVLLTKGLELLAKTR